MSRNILNLSKEERLKLLEWLEPQGLSNKMQAELEALRKELKLAR